GNRGLRRRLGRGGFLGRGFLGRGCFLDYGLGFGRRRLRRRFFRHRLLGGDFLSRSFPGRSFLGNGLRFLFGDRLRSGRFGWFSLLFRSRLSHRRLLGDGLFGDGLIRRSLLGYRFFSLLLAGSALRLFLGRGLRGRGVGLLARSPLGLLLGHRLFRRLFQSRLGL